MAAARADRRARPPLGRIEVAVADLLAQEVDAIVNAANEELRHGAGVAAAIARAAGPELERESRAAAPCPTGEAVVTGAGDLAQRAVIHAVGPRWAGGGAGEPELLASCHRAAVARAEERAFASIALPAISTGIYGYPVELAAPVAARALAEALDGARHVRVARICLLDDEVAAVYRRAVAEL